MSNFHILKSAKEIIGLNLMTFCLFGAFCCNTSLFGQSKVVFSENFDNAISIQPWAPYYSTGWINKVSNTLQSVSGRGKVLHINYAANTVGNGHGLGNYRIPLDSAYKELYLSWEYFVPVNFDFGFGDGIGGGKFFAGFAGGSMTAIPNTDATDVDGWVSMFMFQNGYSTTYNYFKGSSFSGGWPLGSRVAPIAKGQWRRMSIRIKVNDGDQSNGIFEAYDNDVLVYQLPNAKIVNSSHPEYLIEHIYLNSFFGGSGSQYVSPINQFMEFDNIVAFYYPRGSSGYRSGVSEQGRVLQVPQATVYHPVPPNKFSPATYTQASGTISSHCGFYQPADHVEGFESSGIQVTGATSININVTKFNFDKGVGYTGYKQILKIYQGTGSGRVLKKTWQNGINTAPGSITISGGSATIEWQAGQGSHNGFTLNYTTNGSGSGKNFACSSCVAKQVAGSTVNISAPAAPTNLTFSNVTAISAMLNWTDNSSNETSFEIERTGPNSTTTIQKFQAGSNSTSFASSGLIGNSTYTYRIRAYNTGGYSAYSNTVQLITSYALPDAQSGLPNAPSALTSTAITSSTITLNWKDNSGNESGFIIERSLSSSGGFTVMGKVGTNITSFANTTLRAGAAYYYRIKAYNQAGYSSSTPVLAVKTNTLKATSDSLQVGSMDRELVPYCITLYPNPSKDYINILIEIQGQLPAGLEQQKLKILDITGNTIFSRFVNISNARVFEDKIDVSQYSSGLHFIVLQYGNKSIIKKLIINK